MNKNKKLTSRDLFWLVPSFLIIIFLYFPLQFKSSNYPFTNPPIFFSIGEAMAAIAILLAVYQFKKEKWAIALEVKKYLMPVVYVCVVIGFSMIIFSSIAPLVKDPNILLSSIFWQILSSIIIIFAILFLFFGATNEELFNDNTKKEFISALLRRLMSRSSQQMDAIVDVLSLNFETIIKEIETIPRSGEVSEFKKSSYFILTQIMSNPHFTNHVVTTRADFLQQFIHSIKKYKLYSDRNIEMAFSAFARALFSNKDSFFYNELRHSDLGVYYKPFLEDIFFDQNIFINMRPFEQIDFDFGEYVDIEKLSLFTEALQIALKGYFDKSKSTFGEYSHFIDAFEKVEKAFSRIIEEARNDESKNGWYIINKMHQVTFFVGWRFKDMYKEALKKGTVSQGDLDVLVDKRSYGTYPASLTAGFAKLIFDLMCVLGKYPDKDAIRDYAISLTDDFIFFEDKDFANIRKRLLEYIWEKIETDHASNIKGFYPVILPVFLTIVGMRPDGRSLEEKNLYNQTVNFLENKLKPKIISGEKMANDELMEDVLLPNEVIFNREKNLFEWKMRKGIQEMSILA